MKTQEGSLVMVPGFFSSSKARGLSLPFRSSFFLLVFLVAQSLQADTQLTVLDQNNNPVKNAVITVPGIKAYDIPEQPIMDQVDKQFLPKVLLINRGQLVRFPNSDDIRHHVYSFSKPKVFEIKLFKGESAQPVKFNNAGLVVLGCNIHDSMVGYIYVADDIEAALSNHAGKVTLRGNPSRILVWHPQLSADKTYQQTYELGDGESTLRLSLLQDEQVQKKKKGFKAKYKRGKS